MRTWQERDFFPTKAPHEVTVGSSCISIVGLSEVSDCCHCSPSRCWRRKCSTAKNFRDHRPQLRSTSCSRRRTWSTSESAGRSVRLSVQFGSGWGQKSFTAAAFTARRQRKPGSTSQRWWHWLPVCDSARCENKQGSPLSGHCTWRFWWFWTVVQRQF